MKRSHALSFVARATILLLLAGRFPKGEIRAVPYDVTPNGSVLEPGDDDSGLSVDISASGKFVTSTSEAQDLVPPDGNPSTDIFIRRR